MSQYFSGFPHSNTPQRVFASNTNQAARLWKWNYSCAGWKKLFYRFMIIGLSISLFSTAWQKKWKKVKKKIQQRAAAKTKLDLDYDQQQRCNCVSFCLTLARARARRTKQPKSVIFVTQILFGLIRLIIMILSMIRGASKVIGLTDYEPNIYNFSTQLDPRSLLFLFWGFLLVACACFFSTSWKLEVWNN